MACSENYSRNRYLCCKIVGVVRCQRETLVGCKKISPGCLNCYVYRRNAEFGKDSSTISKTASFHLPIKRSRSSEYKPQPGGECVYTCMTSDFF